VNPHPSLGPEELAVASFEAERWMGLAVAAAARAGLARDDIGNFAEQAWDQLAALQSTAAFEAGQTATSRRGPRAKKGRRP
jgi:hypothetical protein